MIKRISVTGALSLLPLIAIVACSSKTTSTDSSNDDGNEAAAASAQASHLGEIVFSSVSSQDPTAAAASASVGNGQLWPAGCATRTKDANPRVVHIVFNDCTGPFGLAHLNGEMIVTFSAGANGALHSDHQSNGLTVNGKPITHSVSADITVSGATRNITWHGVWNRTNNNGDTVAHTSDMAIVLDTAAHCRTGNGTAVTTVDAREVDSTIKDYKICRNPDGTDGCPSGTVTHLHKLAGKSVSVTFDGTNQATITGPNGGTVKVGLVCGI